MLLQEQHDQIVKVILTSIIISLILYKVSGMGKAFTILGLIANTVGTLLFILGEIRREAAFQKYKSSEEGTVFFNVTLQRQKWYIQAIIRMAVWLLGRQGKVEEWAKSVSNMDEDQLKELATKVGGLGLLLMGFFLQLIGVCLPTT